MRIRTLWWGGGERRNKGSSHLYVPFAFASYISSAVNWLHMDSVEPSNHSCRSRWSYKTLVSPPLLWGQMSLKETGLKA